MKSKGLMIEAVDSKNNALEVLLRLLKEYVRPYTKQLIYAAMFMTIVAGCSATIVRLVEPIINRVFLARDVNMLSILPAVVLSIHSLKGLAEYYQSYLVKYVGQRILTDLQMRMYSHLLSADWAFLQSQSSGRLISRFTNDISLMRGAVSNLLLGCAKHFLSVLFLIILMFKLEPVLSLVVFIAFPLAIYPIQRIGRRIRKTSNLTQEELGNYTARLDETFQSIRVIKSFATEKLESRRAARIADSVLDLYKKIAKFDALTSPIMEILSGAAVGGILWYGGSLIIEGKTTPGALLAFVTAFVSAYRPFKSLLSLNVDLQEGLAAARRVFRILDLEPSIKDAKEASSQNFDKVEIRVSNLSLELFGKKVLKDINLYIKPGTITALVGRSGSGKTSLANVLARFYEPCSGELLMNGIDFKNITLDSLRKHISLATQETMLFDSSISENIAYGCSNIHAEQISKAAKLADAHEFIRASAEGYQSCIGIQGVKLSGGQRQRVSLARAIAKDAPVLILDEATSAVDPKSERRIIEALEYLRSTGKTILIITHRLGSIINSDNIVVMKDGIVVEQGTHNDLLKLSGEYRTLYSKELETIDEIP